jgi:hypothetical protein
MLTFLTTAKPFVGHSGITQRNALKSWKLLHPDVEVILFGDEEGAAEVCAEFGLRHEPEVERHESGMKFLDHMVASAQHIALHNYLCYSNCDIVLMDDFWRAFEKAVAWRKRFLLVAQRWDTDVTVPINFDSREWKRDLRRLALTTGVHQHPNFVDFFVFPKGLYDYVPNLVVGRSYWDHWLVWKALSAGAPVLDCTAFVVPVHQNHEYKYHPKGKVGTSVDAVARRNLELCGQGRQLRSILDSTHKLTKYGRVRWTPFRRKLQELPAGASIQRLWQSLLNKTFSLRSRVGLRRRTVEKMLSHKNESPD